MIDRDALRAWLEQSCAVQGVPVFITDSSAVARVGVLLRDRDAAGRPPAGGDRSARPLQSPSGNDSTRVELAGGPSLPTVDGGKVEDGGDDSGLPR